MIPPMRTREGSRTLLTPTCSIVFDTYGSDEVIHFRPESGSSYWYTFRILAIRDGPIVPSKTAVVNSCAGPNGYGLTPPEMKGT